MDSSNTSKATETSKIIGLCRNLGISYCLTDEKIIVNKFSFDDIYKYGDRINLIINIFKKTNHKSPVIFTENCEFYIAEFIVFFMKKVATKKEDFIGHFELDIDTSHLDNKKLHLTYKDYKNYLLELHDEIKELEDIVYKNVDYIASLQINYENRRNNEDNENDLFSKICKEIIRFSLNFIINIVLSTLYLRYK